MMRSVIDFLERFLKQHPRVKSRDVV